MELIEKASFDWLNKLFEIVVSEQDHKVLLSDKNLHAMISEPKLYVLPILYRVALSSLMPNEHYVLKDLPFYKVTRLANSKARQARLKEREKKR